MRIILFDFMSPGNDIKSRKLDNRLILSWKYDGEEDYKLSR